jgi:colicin import membrane protein
MRLEPAGYSASINFDQLNAVAALSRGERAVRLKPPRDGSLLRSLGLAFAAHAFLVLMLVIGTAWTTSPPAVIEAELWAPLPREAAPRQVAPPEPQPKPVEQPQEKPTPPPQKVQEDREAEIALEKEKRKKEEEQRKLDAEKKEREEEKKREEQQKKEAEQKAKADKAKAAEAAQKRQEEFTRQLMAQAGTGAPTSAGTAEKAASPRGDASYAAQVVAAVRANTVFDEASIPNNNPAIFRVDLLPDGTPATVQLTKSSGDTAFDNAVERGIRKTNPFPRPASGAYPRTIEIIYRPRR